MIIDFVIEIGSYLVNEVEFKNEQEKVLVDFWSVVLKDEQYVIVNMMVKFVENNSIY